jgi:hydroxymethylpyrimidine pyrophosphatase-like HAD family hydrolase
MRAREMPRRLLAVDLDGTLVRADGVIVERDRAAIARARRAGVAVTIATGRLAPTVIAIARELGLDAPLVCADGAALVCAQSGRVLEATTLPEAALARLVEAFATRALAPFLCFPDGIAGDEAGAALAGWVAGWSTAIETHVELAASVEGRAGEVVMALGIGPRDRVEAAFADAAPILGTADLAVFGLGEGAPWALRAQPRGAAKHAALARLAARLGVARANVAAVGDWYNDVSMLAWAGRSFAMGHSPEAVRDAAGAVLDATASTGGGVAEAIERWLGV